MYAMSVSPLSYGILGKTSPALVSGLGGIFSGNASDRGKARAGAKPDEKDHRLKRARDFTNNIKIGGEVFEMETVKGKKQVKLPWERLKTVIDNINPETAAMYKNLRGIIIVDGKYSLLGGEKLFLILSLAPSLGIDGTAERSRFQKKNFNSSSNLDELITILPHLVKPALWKGGREKTTNRKDLGFISLYSDGNGSYWTQLTRSFHTSLNESLSSVETLIDELSDDVEKDKKRIVNQCYRRLSDFLA